MFSSQSCKIVARLQASAWPHRAQDGDIAVFHSSYTLLTICSYARSVIGAKLAFHVSQSVVLELKSLNEQSKFRKELGGLVHY